MLEGVVRVRCSRGAFGPVTSVNVVAAVHALTSKAVVCVCPGFLGAVRAKVVAVMQARR